MGRIWQTPKDIQGPTNDHSTNLKIPGGTSMRLSASTWISPMQLALSWFGVFSSLPVCLWPPYVLFLGGVYLQALGMQSWSIQKTSPSLPFNFQHHILTVCLSGQVSIGDLFFPKIRYIYWRHPCRTIHLSHVALNDCQHSEPFSRIDFNIALMQLHLGFDAVLIGIPAGLRALKCDNWIDLTEDT